MATAVVCILCLVLIVMGGMTMSQGILSTSDSAALSVEEISVREGEIIRTDISAVRAAELSWADLVRITVENTGQTRLASFDKWDLIVHYSDGDGNYYNKWLPYSGDAVSDNEWQKAGIRLGGQPEIFEPWIVNPGEEIIVLSRLSPPPGDGSAGDITIATPNGICDSISFYCPGYTLLVPHAEDINIAGTCYFELAEAAFSDGPAITGTTDIFEPGELGRKIMHDGNNPPGLSRHLFPLTGVSEIPAATWTIYYRCRASGLSDLSDNEACLSIDIFVRKADGTLRTALAGNVAAAHINGIAPDTWVTLNASCDFPGYTVVDDSDFLEIDYYGELLGDGSATEGSLQLMIDDSTLPEADQTRIEA